MIVSHRAQLDALAGELLENEVLDRDAIERVMAGVPRLERRPGVGLRVVAAAVPATLPVAAPDGLIRSSESLDLALSDFSSRDTRLRVVFNRIDHIGVAVEDIDASLALYRDAFHMAVAHREIVEEQGVEAVLLDVGENHVELLAPLGPDTPVGKFLAKRGPGLHHVAYQVSDIEATLAALAEAGQPLIDKAPRVGIRGALVAFLEPKGTARVLTELVQPVEAH